MKRSSFGYCIERLCSTLHIDYSGVQFLVEFSLSFFVPLCVFFFFYLLRYALPPHHSVIFSHKNVALKCQVGARLQHYHIKNSSPPRLPCVLSPPIITQYYTPQALFLPYNTLFKSQKTHFEILYEKYEHLF